MLTFKKLLKRLLSTLHKFQALLQISPLVAIGFSFFTAAVFNFTTAPEDFPIILVLKTAHPSFYQLLGAASFALTNLTAVLIIYSDRIYYKLLAIVFVKQVGTIRCFTPSEDPKGDFKINQEKKEVLLKCLEQTTTFTYIGICAFEILGGKNLRRFNSNQGYMYRMLLDRSQDPNFEVNIYMLHPKRQDVIKDRISQLEQPDYDERQLTKQMLATITTIKSLIGSGLKINLYLYKEFPFIRAFIFDDKMIVSFYEKKVHGEDTVALEILHYVDNIAGQREKTIASRQFTAAFGYFVHELEPFPKTKYDDLINKIKDILKSKPQTTQIGRLPLIK